MNSFPQREKSTPLHFKYITMCSFSQGEFENFLRHIAAFRSDHQLGADVLLKLLALDQFLRTNEQDEGTLGRTEHTLILVTNTVSLHFGIRQVWIKILGRSETIRNLSLLRMKV